MTTTMDSMINGLKNYIKYMHKKRRNIYGTFPIASKREVLKEAAVRIT